MKLSLVIPVRNDPEGLARLLAQTRDLAWLGEILVFDDASDPPCGSGMAGLSAAAADPRIHWLRTEDWRGAGHARNRALDHVTGEHLLFFDSDDVLLPAMADIVAELAGRTFDFCLFRHVESTTSARGMGLMPGEEAYWDAAPPGMNPTPLPPERAEWLCRMAAYPWNKIYRTAFLRENAIRCTEIPVHNDIELHWTSFLHARRILTCRQAGAEHFVTQGAGRITNQRGRERLEVFRAFEAVQQALRHSPRGREFRPAFTDFCLRLSRWIGRNLDPAWQEEFDSRFREHLRAHLPASAFTLLALDDPELAGRVIARLEGAA